MTIQHHKTCSSDYPEKTKDEPAQATTDIGVGDGTVSRSCNDCGAFEIIPGMKISEWLSTQTGSHEIQDHKQLSASFECKTGYDTELPSHSVASTRQAIKNRGLGGDCAGEPQHRVAWGYEVAIHLAREHVPDFRSTKMGRGFAWREAIDALKAAGK